jgi:hypothetical protein
MSEQRRDWEVFGLLLLRQTFGTLPLLPTKDSLLLMKGCELTTNV